MPHLPSFEDCLQVRVDPSSKLPGLLNPFKLIDAAMQQNIYHKKGLADRSADTSADFLPDWVAEHPVRLLRGDSAGLILLRADHLSAVPTVAFNLQSPRL